MSSGDVRGNLSGDLSRFSMLDLFRMEAEAQARALTDGLLRLERGNGDGAMLEELMRAAHSVKGAAAIVGLSPIVGLAHVMEDAFVAAQGGRQLNAPDVDALLAAVDLTQALAALPDAELADVQNGYGAALDEAVETLAALRKEARPTAQPSGALDAAAADAAAVNATAADALPAAGTPVAGAPAAGAPAAGAPAAANTAPGADELLSLAGQARLHAHQLAPWIGALQRHRRQQRGVTAALEELHDAVLRSGQPELLEKLGVARDRTRPLEGALHRMIQEAENYERRATSVATRLVDGARTLSMCPFGEGVHALPRMVRDLARSLGKDAQLLIEGAATLVDRAVLARIEGPLNQLLRNAIDHGMETPDERRAAGKPPCGTIRLAARHRAGMLVIEVDDDGRGVDPERIRRAAVARRLAPPAFAPALTRTELMDFLFLPGFSLKEEANQISGRGVGLDVVHETVQRLNGNVRAESRPGLGFRTLITLPLTQSIVRALVVDILGEAYALPIARVARVLALPESDVRTLSGRQYVELEGDGADDRTDSGRDDGGGNQVSLVSAAHVLELGEAHASASLPIIVIGAGRERYGLVVDAIRGEQSLTVQPLEPAFGKLRDVAAGALLDDGRPVLILDVPDLLQSIARLLDEGAPLRVLAGTPATGAGAGKAARARRHVLVVDDSLTVREMQRKILSAHGYEVDTAIDGIEGWNMLRAADYDLLVTDIDMPRLDGIELLGRVRQDARLKRLPAMVVSYKDRPEDRARGLDAGADYYLAKGAFHDATLLDAVRDLIGEARRADGDGDGAGGSTGGST
jgi:two-component system sensor histidine kinase and response regulator WspE